MINNVILLLLHSFSLVLPIFLSGILLVIILQKQYFTQLEYPIDNGLMINKKRIFGDNKTFLGVIVYVGGSMVVAWLLHVMQSVGIGDFIHHVYGKDWLIAGLAMGVSYVFGELLNSFIKRRLGITPGSVVKSRWRQFQRIIDHVDGMIVVALVFYIFMVVDIWLIVIGVGWGIVLHKAVNVWMKRLNLRTE